MEQLKRLAITALMIAIAVDVAVRLVEAVLPALIGILVLAFVIRGSIAIVRWKRTHW